MRYAIIGNGVEISRIEEALTSLPDAEIVNVGESAGLADSDPSTMRPELTGIEAWEAILSGSLADGVVFARDSNSKQRDDQLRKLVQAGIPILAVYPACDVLLGFELQMIQRDTGGVIIPYWPGNRHPLLGEIQKWCRDERESPLGPIQQLVLQRVLAPSQRQEVLDTFARDAEILGRLMGGVDQLGALGRGALGRESDQETLNNLSVHMSTSQGCLARWSTLPQSNSSDSELSVVGQRGQAKLSMPPDPSQWSLTVIGGTGDNDEPCGLGEVNARWNDVENIVSVFQSAIGQADDGTDWDHACRGLELADTVEQSLRRGKTIHLYGVEHTEEATFKTMMAAGGCLALLATLGVVLLLAGLDALGLTAWGTAVWKKWPFVLLAGLLVFLALQLLRFVFPDAPAKKQPS